MSVVPLSLLALHCCIQSLSLSRIVIDLDFKDMRSLIGSSLLTKMAGDIDKASQPTGNIMKQDARTKPTYKNGQCMNMQHIFRKHVKPKKQHEIHQLGQVISLLSQVAACNTVVDVGAGLGHLSRLLTFQHGLKVTTVEAADGHAPIAAALDRELMKDITKANERQKVLSAATLNLENSVKDSQDTNSVNKDPLQNEPFSFQNNRYVQYNGNDSANCLGTHKNTQSVLPYTNFPKSDASSQLATVCDHRCNLQSSPYSSPKKSTFHELSNVNSPLGHGMLSQQDHVTHGPVDHVTPRDLLNQPSFLVDDVLPNHLVFKVQPDIAACHFLDIIKQKTQADNGTKDETSKNFILVGLHACGDLTPTLLRVFVNCPTAIGLASVACCYMKISTSKYDHPGTNKIENYPMSRYVRGLPNYHLSYVARELACHFAESYFKRLKESSPHLKIHSFRAALQFVIKTVNPDFKSGTVRLDTKTQAPDTFLQYARDCLKKVKIDINTIPQDLLEHCDTLQKFWRRVVAFYTLRLSFAPAVESLILLDRALYLLENGIPCVIMPVFDSTISPRNFALLAIKN